MELHSESFLENAGDALKDTGAAERRDAIGVFAPLLRSAAVDAFEGFDALREHVKHIRQHSLDNLAHYLGRFEQEAVANGNRVHYALDGEEMNSIVLDICQQHEAQRIAKGKSMVTEETRLNGFLKRAGLEVMETDLGEYIVQLAGETPSHIVGPALHKSAGEVRALFKSRHKLGERELEETADLVAEARHVLREHFLNADVGIIGSNALVAENGYSMLVTNEGNGDLCANLPRVLIICTTIDRVLPRAEDATAMLRLLVRSATGQPHTCYTSFYSGPRRAGDIDGPIETHFILLDNKRSNVLTSDYREILECIRCGTCLTHCPIYTSVGGHAYGSVYQGPMGSVLTPLLTSLEQAQALPNACTTCGPLRRGLPRRHTPSGYAARFTPRRTRAKTRLTALAAGAQGPRLARRTPGPLPCPDHGSRQVAAHPRTQTGQPVSPALRGRLDKPARLSRTPGKHLHAALQVEGKTPP